MLTLRTQSPGKSPDLVGAGTGRRRGTRRSRGKGILDYGFFIFPRGCGTRFRVDWGGDCSRKAPTRVGAQTRSAKARSGWGKGAIRMDMEDPCLLTQSPLRSGWGDWLFGMGYWFVALLRSVSVNLAELRRAPATGGWEWGSRIRGTRHRGCGTRSRALLRALACTVYGWF
jgi:hypothetical protein